MLIKENYNVEFKGEFIEKIQNEILAFINSDGGTIYIGVEDDGNIIGIPKEKQDMIDKILSSWIRDSFYPNVNPYVKYFINDKDVLVIQVKKGLDKPYYLKSKGPIPTGVYIRIGSTTRQATNSEIRKMIKDSMGYMFEEEISKNQDLHFIRLSRYFESKNIEFNETKYQTLNIKNKEGQFTNFGLLVSDENPIEFKFAVYKGTTCNEFLIKKELKGSIIEITSELLHLAELHNHVSAKIVSYQPQRIEVKSYPGASLREAIMNAICHADYSVRSNIKVEVYDNRVQITSPGGIYGDASLKDLLDGVQTFRNPSLVNALSKLDMIENYGTGLKKIIEAYPLEKYNIDDLFHISVGYFIVILYNMNYKESKSLEINQEKAQETAQEKAQEVTQETLTEDERNIINLMKENPKITRSKIEKILNLTKDQVRYKVGKLKRIGYITRVDSTKAGYWKILK